MNLTTVNSPRIDGKAEDSTAQGELQGYEIREYLLEKWGRKCSYCDKIEAKLQVEHIVAESKGGSNRVSNLCLACEICNQKKEDC